MPAFQSSETIARTLITILSLALVFVSRSNFFLDYCSNAAEFDGKPLAESRRKFTPGFACQSMLRAIQWQPLTADFVAKALSQYVTNFNEQHATNEAHCIVSGQIPAAIERYLINADLEG